MHLITECLRYTEMTLARAAAPLDVKRQPETFIDEILSESFNPIHKARAI